MRIDQLVNSKLTPPEELVAASLKLKSWAHQEENYRHLVVDGEGKVVQDRPMDDRHKTRIKLPGWDTKITVVYSVDDLPEWNLDCTFEERLAELEGNLDALNDGLPRRKVRHLSIQISIPGNFTTAQVRMVPEFLQWYEPMVKVFFPLHEQIRATLIAHPAVHDGVEQRGPTGVASTHRQRPDEENHDPPDRRAQRGPTTSRRV